MPYFFSAWGPGDVRNPADDHEQAGFTPAVSKINTVQALPAVHGVWIVREPPPGGRKYHKRASLLGTPFVLISRAWGYSPGFFSSLSTGHPHHGQ